MNRNDILRPHPKTELFVFDHLTGELEIVEVKDALSPEESMDPKAGADNPKAKADSSIKINDEVVTLDILPVRC